MRYCVVCGSPLRTGIKYCYQCKNPSLYIQNRLGEIQKNIRNTEYDKILILFVIVLFLLYFIFGNFIIAAGLSLFLAFGMIIYLLRRKSQPSFNPQIPTSPNPPNPPNHKVFK